MARRGKMPAVTVTVLDRAIAWLDPARGLARQRAKIGLAMVGGYEGGRRDRRSLRSWRPFGGSADADILPDLTMLRERSRDLIRNVPVAAGAINTVTTNVVGEGLSVQSMIDADFLGLDADEATEWQKNAEREFAMFATGVDITGVQSFVELQALVFRSALESGDRFGRPIVLHVFDRTRPGQTRGVPYLAPVIEDLKQFGRFTAAEVDAAVINAFFAVWIKTPDAGGLAPIAGTAEAGSDGQDVKLESGLVQELAPGEEPFSLAPGRPNPEFDHFTTAFLRHVGVALELPFEILVKHFTASYSASRAALEMAWQFFRRRRAWIVKRFCQPVYEMMLDEAVATGRIEAPGYFDDPLRRAAWSRAQWTGNARISLDPKKEADADKLDLEMGTKTRRQIMIERTGGDFDEKTTQLQREAEARKAAGLVSAPAPAMTPPPAIPPPADDDDDDNEDEE